MDYLTLMSNTFSAGAGAFAGALAAYFLACHQDKRRAIADYLNLLLIVHEHLDAVYKIFTNIPPESIKEIDGEKMVIFTMPFPKFALTSQQFQTLMNVSQDKQMPAALIQFNNFLTVHAQRISKDGVNLLPLQLVQQQENQLKFMLLSVRVQYEQQTNDAFPLE